MTYGYNNKILRVDLNKEMTSVEEPGNKFYRTYFGGTALGAYYLLKELKPHVDALSEDNNLIFAPGLLTGTLGPALPRYTVMARSPLTGTIGKSEAGGFFGPALKQAGFDAIIVTGKAKKPVYLYIEEGNAEIKSATHLWGMGTGKCQKEIRKTHGEAVCVATTGIAGENMVLYANICNDLAHFNGRNGLGAVMGSKMLKAVAVKTKGKQLQIKDEKTIEEITRSIAGRMKDNPLAWNLHVNGTPAGIETLNAAGFLPTNNWQSGVFEGANKIGAVAMKNILVHAKGCYSCPLRCKRIVETDDIYHVDPAYGGPELETLGALGSNLGIDNLNLLSKANELCNDYSLDTISFGMTLSFAIECFEKGYLSLADTNGMELKFGNEEILLPLIHMTAKRSGFGEILANGSYRMAKKLGEHTMPMLMTVKGQEPPLHDPRWKSGIALQYALSYNGADHWVAEHDQLLMDNDSPGLLALNPLGILDPIPTGEISWQKTRMFYYTHLLVNAFDCLGACALGYAPRSEVGITELITMLKASTGWDTSLWEVMKVGERAVNMQRLFNRREGFGREDDMLPERFFKPLLTPSGEAVLDKEKLIRSIDMFYGMAGWDEMGNPKNAKLYELCLAEFADLGG